jgi:hypothetical protein
MASADSNRAQIPHDSNQSHSKLPANLPIRSAIVKLDTCAEIPWVNLLANPLDADSPNP